MLNHTIHLLFNNKLDSIEELYLSVSLRTLAVSMVSIFFPIYLMQKDYSFVYVIIFFIVWKGTHFLTVTPAVHFASRFGFKHASAISLPILVLFFVTSLFVEGNLFLFFATAVMGGVSNALYWTGYHTQFSRFSQKNHRGEELGISYVFRATAGFLGPIIGGLIITFAGFTSLFISVALLAFVAALPLIVTKDNFAPINISFRGIFRKRSFKEIIPFLGFGIENTMSLIFWPIFVFSILGTFTSLGAITSFALFFALVVTLVVSKYTDGDRIKPLVIGAYATAFAWFIRSFVFKPVQVLVADPLYVTARTSLLVPYNAKAYDNANSGERTQYIAFREIGISLGEIIALLVLIITGLTQKAFIMGMLAPLLFLFI